MLENLFILWLGILPFITFQGRYEIPKIIYFLIGSFPLCLYWIYKVIPRKARLEFGTKDLLFLAWLLILLISSFLGVHPFESLFGGSYRHQGVIFFLLIWLIWKTAELLTPAKKKLLVKTIGFAVILESLIALFQKISGNVYFGRPLGSLGEANAVAGFVALGSYFVYEAFPKLVLVLPFLTILLAQSRSGALSFLVFIGSLVSNMSKKRKYKLIIILLSLGLIMIFALSGNKPNSLYENRATFWEMGVKQVIKRPILGYGAESGEVVYKEGFIKSGFPLEGVIVDRAHNLFIDLAMWSGLIGLGTFLLWLKVCYKNLEQTSQKLAFWAFIVYASIQPLSIVHWILFFLIL